MFFSIFQLVGTNLSTAEAVGITLVISSLVSFAIGGLVLGLTVHCYHIHKQKDRYAPQQRAAPMYEEVSAKSGNIEMRENLAYGPIIH